MSQFTSSVEAFPPLVSAETSEKIGEKLAPFNPTNAEAVVLALEMLGLREGDVLYDLGCGDGRLLIEGCRQFSSVTGLGVEFDSALCDRARECVASYGFNDRVSI